MSADVLAGICGCIGVVLLAALLAYEAWKGRL